MVRGRALRNRVFGQTWCSATSCPVSAALTLSNTSTRHQTRKVGQGEALVACMDCSFSATSVSIVDGEAVCAAASSTNVARVVCVAVCQWEGLDCTCSSGCSSNELGSESIHTYSYQVTAASGVRELLGYLHRLASRVHNTAEHLNIAGQLDMPGKSRQVRANVERRFGRDRAKAVPLLFYGPGNMSRR
ncbi:uncharacterized protein LOC113216858 [Frankliniella occidentalis]|uniref:Uncharacterized protein LOC113216858 n=1 Tax=Frankliniella occidentalis TaxID=133901 RepID=A0A9C6TR58_FRAOC|nr:uncharacterized protein LOC113216858 [Frankliniella occidentalis]